MVQAIGSQYVAFRGLVMQLERAGGRDAYMVAVRAVMVNPATISRVVHWLTKVCPEFDNPAGIDGDDYHVVIGGFVAIGCEGYRVINPNAVGIDDPDWGDWSIK